jgi:hypothetical protein
MSRLMLVLPNFSEGIHHAAHENCFIANSVKTNVTVAERKITWSGNRRPSAEELDKMHIVEGHPTIGSERRLLWRERRNGC